MNWLNRKYTNTKWRHYLEVIVLSGLICYLIKIYG